MNGKSFVTTIHELAQNAVQDANSETLDQQAIDRRPRTWQEMADERGEASTNSTDLGDPSRAQSYAPTAHAAPTKRSALRPPRHALSTAYFPHHP